MSGGPRCPQHKVKLLNCKNGVGQCPISGYEFAYTAIAGSEKKKLTTGGAVVMESEYKVEGQD